MYIKAWRDSVVWAKAVQSPVREKCDHGSATSTVESECPGFANFASP